MSIETLKRREDFGLWLNEHGLKGSGVEVGTLYGEYMEVIMEVWGGEKLTCIDPWERQPSEVYKEPVNNNDWGEIYAAAKYRANKFPGRVALLKDYSPGAALGFENKSLDFVYIDSNHGLKFIRDDLNAWWNKVKQGGLICGHDFYNDTKWPSNCMVKHAVMLFAKQRKLNIHYTPPCGSWWIVKP